jgi:endonuclease YncB( thermonuclease family)
VKRRSALSVYALIFLCLCATIATIGALANALNSRQSPPGQPSPSSQAQVIISSRPTVTDVTEEPIRVPTIARIVPPPPDSVAPPLPISAAAPPTLGPAPSSRGPSSKGKLQQVVVDRVVDGDTLSITIGGAPYKVRIIGVDTPETVDPRRPVMCYGAEATSKTKELIALAGNVVFLEKDVSETDKYGRLLRYVWLDLPDGRLMLNEILVEEGYAQVATYPPDVKYQDLFIAAQREARENNRGLWVACGAFGIPAFTPSPSASAPAPAVFGDIEIVKPPGAVGRNNIASLTIRTAPDTTCSIVVHYSSGPSRAMGLENKQADASGLVTWSWMVGANTNAGTWPITITCGDSTTESSVTVP